MRKLSGYLYGPRNLKQPKLAVNKSSVVASLTVDVSHVNAPQQNLFSHYFVNANTRNNLKMYVYNNIIIIFFF